MATEEGQGSTGHCDFCPGWDGEPARLMSRAGQDPSGYGVEDRLLETGRMNVGDR